MQLSAYEIVHFGFINWVHKFKGFRSKSRKWWQKREENIQQKQDKNTYTREKVLGTLKLNHFNKDRSTINISINVYRLANLKLFLLFM